MKGKSKGVRRELHTAAESSHSQPQFENRFRVREAAPGLAANGKPPSVQWSVVIQAAKKKQKRNFSSKSTLFTKPLKFGVFPSHFAANWNFRF